MSTVRVIKPITVDNYKPVIGDSASPVLLLNVTTCNMVWFERAVNLGRVTSREGQTLPPELWYIIMRFVDSDPTTYALVQARSTRRWLDYIGLRCQVVNFQDTHKPEQRFTYPDDFAAYQDALHTPSLHSKFLTFCTRSKNYELQYFDVLLPPKPSKVVAPCLFCDMSTAQVIRCVDLGECWLCGGVRFLSSSKMNLAFEFLELLQGVDFTRLVCPMCVGWDIFGLQCEYLENNNMCYPTRAEQRAWEKRLIIAFYAADHPAMAFTGKVQRPDPKLWELIRRGALSDRPSHEKSTRYNRS